MDINESIKKAIQEQLPGAVAEELRVFIEVAQKTERELAAAKLNIERKAAELKQHGNLSDRHSRLDQQEAEQTKRADELQAKELALLKIEAKLAAAVSKAELAIFREVTGMFLKNRIIRESTIGMVPVAQDATPGMPGYGCVTPAMVTQNSISAHTTKETE